jgi:hypothetical protein
MIHEADPEIVEECKWIKPSNPLGVPVWSRAGIVCTGGLPTGDQADLRPGCLRGGPSGALQQALELVGTLEHRRLVEAMADPGLEE